MKISPKVPRQGASQWEASGRLAPFVGSRARLGPQAPLLSVCVRSPLLRLGAWGLEGVNSESGYFENGHELRQSAPQAGAAGRESHMSVDTIHKGSRGTCVPAASLVPRNHQGPDRGALENKEGCMGLRAVTAAWSSRL